MNQPLVLRPLPEAPGAAYNTTDTVSITIPGAAAATQPLPRLHERRGALGRAAGGAGAASRLLFRRLSPVTRLAPLQGAPFNTMSQQGSPRYRTPEGL